MKVLRMTDTDLRGKRVSIPLGTSYDDAFEHAKHTVFTVEENPGGVQARLKQLLAGRTDVAVYGNGRAKLARKGCDLLVVNEVGERKTFGSEENEAVVLGADGSETPVPYGPKEALAETVWDLVVSRLG